MANADRQSIKITWNFGIKESDEVAVTGLNYSSAAGFSTAAAVRNDLEGTMSIGEDLMDLMAALLSESPMYWADYSELRSVRIAAVGMDGLEIGLPVEREPTTPYSGTITNTLPQSTVCCSLRSGSTTGVANYGRMFLPHTRIPLVAATARAAPSITSQVATHFKDFVNGVTALVDGATTSEIFPVIITHKLGAPSKAITSIAVGDITDTQQRRRNRLPEIYSYANL